LQFNLWQPVVEWTLRLNLGPLAVASVYDRYMRNPPVHGTSLEGQQWVETGP